MSAVLQIHAVFLVMMRSCVNPPSNLKICCTVNIELKFDLNNKMSEELDLHVSAVQIYRIVCLCVCVQPAGR